jgi:RNA polymerase sigma-70 factor (ECF subfamily)
MTESRRTQPVAESTVEALRRGDQKAYEELYRLLHARVYNLAARIVGDRGEAEDITQEVFLRAFRHLPGITGPLRPEAWVFRTTVNACYDHLRRRKPAPAEFVDGREAAAGDAFDQAATVAAVEKSLAALNPRYRTALVLKDVHGMSNGEVAEVMGVSSGTVGVLLFRARGTFEKHYREVAPTVGAGVPVAGLVAGLPMLPVPPTLQTPPAFVSTLSGPLSSAPLAPLADSAAPFAEGIGRLSDTFLSKIAILLIAATAVAGGGVAVHEVREDVASRPAAVCTVAAAPDAGASEVGPTSAPPSKVVRGDLTREPAGDAADEPDAASGVRVGSDGESPERASTDSVSGTYVSPGPGDAESAPGPGESGSTTGGDTGERTSREPHDPQPGPGTASGADAQTLDPESGTTIGSRQAPAAEAAS